MNNKKISYKIVLVISTIVLLLLIVASFSVGRYPIKPTDLIEIVFANIFNLQHSLDANFEIVIFNIRLPRIVISLLVGAGISLAGVSYQAVLQNSMASPDILGASSGAAFGAILAMLLGFGSGATTVLAFVFGLFAVVIVMYISKFTRAKKVVGIILAGIIISNFFSAGISFLKLIADPNNELPEITYWLMGGFSASDLNSLQFLAIPFILALIPVFLLSWKMNILTLNDDEANALGVDVSKIRVTIILCATLVTAACVAVSGVVGWIGLIVPNVCRKMVGNDYRKLLPITLIVGGFFMLLVDNIARTAFTTELPISILTAVVGTPFFIYLITKKGV